MKTASKRNLLLALLILLLPWSTFAQRKWTVNAVPNTRLESNSIHVSDPDDFISDSCEMSINTALCSIQDKADVFLVVLGSIGDATPEKFSSLLFERWGIGNAETNNGVLMLLVMDIHKFRFEVGYGAEAVLTDYVCRDITENAIIPYFRNDDYEGGLCSGVAQVVEKFGGEIPVGFVSVLPEKTTETPTESTDELDGPAALFGLLMIGLPIAAFVVFKRNRGRDTASAETFVVGKDKNGMLHYSVVESSWSGNAWEGRGCLRALLVGASLSLWLLVASLIAPAFGLEEGTSAFGAFNVYVAIFLYLTWLCVRHNVKTLRFADKLAAQSGSSGSIYQAGYDYYLTKISLWSALWVGWIFMLIYKKKIKDACNYFCSYCNAKTMKVISSKIIKEATQYETGLKQCECECKCCGKKALVDVTLPKIVKPTCYSGGYGGGSSYGGGSGYSSSGHSSSGGSFGGGRSGGGGYTGSW